MSIGRFFGRVTDAAIGAMPSITAPELERRLDAVVVGVAITAEAAAAGGHSAGFLAVVNVLARLYPTIAVEAPAGLQAEGVALAQAINPSITIASPGTATATISWGTSSDEAQIIGVSARGWHVEIDLVAPLRPTAMPAAVAAAALAASELFRLVFADVVASPRTTTQPTSWSVITLTDEDHEYFPTATIDVGSIALAGCGAIGEAFVAALDDPTVTGTITAIDDEPVDVTNLQRYYLAVDADVDAPKTQLVKRRERPGLNVEEVTERWRADLAQAADTVVVALDTPEDRIAVQASLPAEVFNAYTGMTELGVSRHERFGGDEMCLACLYWPLGPPPPPRHELIGQALGVAAERVLLYSLNRVPVGRPLPPEAFIGRAAELPPEMITQWTRRAVLDDIAVDRNADPATVTPWREAPIDDLYVNGVCGGAWTELSTSDQAKGHVVVPLAHESLMAGALLAAQLLAARSALLRHLRPQATHIALDLRRSSSPRHDIRRPTPVCICRDRDFVGRYEAKHPEPKRSRLLEPGSRQTGTAPGEAGPGPRPTTETSSASHPTEDTA